MKGCRWSRRTKDILWLVSAHQYIPEMHTEPPLPVLSSCSNTLFSHGNTVVSSATGYSHRGAGGANGGRNSRGGQHCPKIRVEIERKLVWQGCKALWCLWYVVVRVPHVTVNMSSYQDISRRRCCRRFSDVTVRAKADTNARCPSELDPMAIATLKLCCLEQSDTFGLLDPFVCTSLCSCNNPCVPCR